MLRRYMDSKVAAMPGDHYWGVSSTNNGDGTYCNFCDGSDGFGTWLAGAPVNVDEEEMFLVPYTWTSITLFQRDGM